MRDSLSRDRPVHDGDGETDGDAPRPSQGRLLSGIDQFVPETLRANADLRRRTRLVVGTAILTTVIAILTAANAGLRNKLPHPYMPPAWLVLGGAALLMALNPVLVRLGVAISKVAVSVLAILFATVSYLTFAYGGVTSSGALWLAIVPLVALSLSGPVAATVTAVLGAVELLFYYSLARAGVPFTAKMPEAEHEWWMLWTICQVILFTWGFALLSERDRSRSHAQIVATNEKLVAAMEARHKAEAALKVRHRAEAVAQLTAGLAHEINTPLQIAGDNVRFLDDTTKELLGQKMEPADLDYVTKELPIAVMRVEESLDRIATIVKVMRELSESDGAPFEETDLNVLLRSAISVVEHRHSETVTVSADLSTLPAVRCRVREIREALLALLFNAAQAVETSKKARKGTVTVRSTVEPEHVVVSISDDGCGIPTKIRDKIFDPFFTTKPLGTALGQGLTIARAILVERHQGTLSFESEEGAGTTFNVRIPLVGEPVSALSPGRALPH